MWSPKNSVERRGEEIPIRWKTVVGTIRCDASDRRLFSYWKYSIVDRSKVLVDGAVFEIVLKCSASFRAMGDKNRIPHFRFVSTRRIVARRDRDTITGQVNYRCVYRASGYHFEWNRSRNEKRAPIPKGITIGRRDGQVHEERERERDARRGRLRDPVEPARTAHINSQGPWQIVARTHPLFFHSGPAVLYFLLHGQNSSVALYALLFKGARSPHPLRRSPYSTYRFVCPSSVVFSHTNRSHEKHHVSLSINDFYGRPPFLFLPRGRKDRAAAPRALP